MIFNNSMNIAFLLILLLSDLVNYYMIRNMLWSIVWCDKGGKYNRLKKLRQEKSFLQKISMRYLEQYTSAHQKDYKFWIKLKLCFEIVEFALLVIYCVCTLFDNNILCEVIKVVIIIQSFAIFIVLITQFDTSRRTKYDRMRVKKHQKRF